MSLRYSVPPVVFSICSGACQVSYGFDKFAREFMAEIVLCLSIVVLFVCLIWFRKQKLLWKLLLTHKWETSYIKGEAFLVRSVGPIFTSILMRMGKYSLFWLWQALETVELWNFFTHSQVWFGVTLLAIRNWIAYYNILLIHIYCFRFTLNVEHQDGE